VAVDDQGNDVDLITVHCIDTEDLTVTQLAYCCLNPITLTACLGMDVGQLPLLTCPVVLPYWWCLDQTRLTNVEPSYCANLVISPGIDRYPGAGLQ